jgi:protease-4
MKQFLITVGGVFVGMVLFSIVSLMILFAGIGAIAAAGGPAATPSDSVLALDLRGGLTDQPAANPLFSLTGGSTSVLSIVQTLARARDDERIKGLLIRLPEGGMDPAAAEEIRQAVMRFKAGGKTVFAHSQGLYASGVTTATYMLGASADQLWMQTGAPFEATGVSTEDIFLKRAFDRYGVQPQFEQREEFKNAVNPYLFADYTPAHRQAQLAWMNAIYQRTLANAAADRKLAPQVLRANLQAGPYDAAQAASAGLVDQLGQVEEAREALLKKTRAETVV